MNGNALRFKELLAKSPALQEEMRNAANAYEGDRDDDRAVFNAVVAPVARSAGMEFTYEEALATIFEGRELEDWQLDAIAGGVGI